MDGEFPPTPYPITPGHEFAGTVAAVAPDVNPTCPGDRVAVDPSLYCGYCRRCRAGRDNLCENWAAIGDTVDGAFAEYVAVPAVNAHRLPEHSTASTGAMVEPLACAVHGLRRLGPVFGDPVVVVGAGTMGLLLLQLLLHAGAGPVAVVDRVAGASTWRASWARRQASPAPRSRRSGSRSRSTRPACPRRSTPPSACWTGAGGCSCSACPPAEALITVSPFRVYNDEITIAGSMAILRSFGQAVDCSPAARLTRARCFARRCRWRTSARP